MYIGFSTNKLNFFSKAIQWWTKSRWSHCFLVLQPIGDNDYLIAEAAFHGGVKFNLLSRYKTSHHDVELLPVPQHCIECLLPYIGSNYGTKQILGFVISDLFKLKRNVFTDDLVCSEFVYLWLINSQLANYFTGLDQNRITPQDIYQILHNISVKKQISDLI